MSSRFMVSSITALAIVFLLFLDGLTWAADKAVLARGCHAIRSKRPEP